MLGIVHEYDPATGSYSPEWREIETANVWNGPVRPTAQHPPSTLNRVPKSTPKKRKPKKGRS